jgi:photosystem II stability/assembly factor-like uncharacterized protein
VSRKVFGFVARLTVSTDYGRKIPAYQEAEPIHVRTEFNFHEVDANVKEISMNKYQRLRKSIWKVSAFAIFLFAHSLTTSSAAAQATRTPTPGTRPPARNPATASGAGRSAQTPKFKAIWEPVSYSEDIQLFDVFFADAQTGWASGGIDGQGSGVILHTQDGGDHWDIQWGTLKSSETQPLKFRFLDATHGWATQGYDHLLHTSDGQNWVIAGTISPYVADYAFTSEKNGVYITAEKILRTVDGGRTWNQVNSCAAKVQVNGLARDVVCTWYKLQFVTPTVGYAIGSFSNVDAAFIGKTVDGGATWSIALGDVTGGPQDGFFFDEKTGYIRTGHSYDGQLYKTTDGGVTWAGGAVSPGDHIRFTDPQVGAASVNNKISFTTDGGQHWITREYAFPAGVNAISMPRRDRAYVVGDHGMVFRYRIVPIDYTKKGTIDAPLLPAYGVPLADKL